MIELWYFTMHFVSTLAVLPSALVPAAGLRRRSTRKTSFKHLYVDTSSGVRGARSLNKHTIRKSSTVI